MKSKKPYRKNYKISLSLIRDVIQQIIEDVHPLKVILFGSYAYGKPNVNSDVDLLIIMNSNKKPVDRSIQIAKSLHFYPFPMDILVRTPNEIRKRIQMGDFFYEDIMKKGRILYDSKTLSGVA